MPAETPIFDFDWAPKKDHLPKTDSCNENAPFCTFWTQIVLAYFSKKCHFNRKTIFFTTTPKHYFLGLFGKFPFPFFDLFYFGLSNIIKTKAKNVFFSETLFWHPDKLPKNIVALLHNICVFKTPKKHSKTREKQAKQNLGQIFSSTLDRFSAQETPNLG